MFSTELYSQQFLRLKNELQLSFHPLICNKEKLNNEKKENIAEGRKREIS